MGQLHCYGVTFHIVVSNKRKNLWREKLFTWIFNQPRTSSIIFLFTERWIEEQVGHFFKILASITKLTTVTDFLLYNMVIDSNSLKPIKNVKTQQILHKKLALLLLIKCVNFCCKWRLSALSLTAQTHTLGFPEHSVMSVPLLLSLCLLSAFSQQRHIMFAYSCHIQVTYKCDCWLQQVRKYSILRFVAKCSVRPPTMCPSPFLATHCLNMPHKTNCS